jgi:hypothetical protein
MAARQETSMTRTHVDTGWHAETAGPARTTHAGRLALPVKIRLGECVVAVVDLVLDGPGAAELRAALDEHLRGSGTPCTAGATR